MFFVLFFMWFARFQILIIEPQSFLYWVDFKRNPSQDFFRGTLYLPVVDLWSWKKNAWSFSNRHKLCQSHVHLLFNYKFSWKLTRDLWKISPSFSLLEIKYFLSNNGTAMDPPDTCKTGQIRCEPTLCRAGNSISLVYLPKIWGL